MIFGNKQYTIQPQDKQVIFAVKVSRLFRIIWLMLWYWRSTALAFWGRKHDCIKNILSEGLKKEDREGLQIEKWGICLGVWRLLGDHLVHKKMMATKNAISFNGNELIIQKKLLWQKGLWRGKWKARLIRPTQPVLWGTHLPKDSSALRLCMARWAHVLITGKMCCNK